MALDVRTTIPGVSPETNRALAEVQNAVRRECQRIEDGSRRPRRNVTELQEANVIAKPGEVVRVLPGEADITVYLPEPDPANAGEDIIVNVEGDGTATGVVRVEPLNGTCAVPGIVTLNGPGAYRFTSTGAVTESASGAGGGSWGGPAAITTEDLPPIDTPEIVDDAVTNAKLDDMPANSVKVNATTGAANPTDLTLPALSVLGRSNGNIEALDAPATVDGQALYFRTNADGSQIDWFTMSEASMPRITDGFFFANMSGVSPGQVLAKNMANMAGPGLRWNTANVGDYKFVVQGSTSIIVGTDAGNDDVERAALTGDVTAAQNVNTTAFRSFTALSVLARAAGTAGIPTELSATTATDAVLRESGGALAFGTVATAGIANDAVTNAKLANMAEALIKGRALGAGTGDPQDLTGVEVGQILREYTAHTASGAADLTDYVPTTGTIETISHIYIDPAIDMLFNSLTTATTGKKIRIVKLANSNQVTIVDEAAAGTAAMRFKCIGNTTTPNIVLRHDGANVLIEYDGTRWNVIEWSPGIATTSNAGLVSPSTSLVMSTSEIQRAALSGFVDAAQNANATTSAEPIVTYSASANMSAERVTTSSTSVTVSTSVASQIEFQRAALTGDVTAAANVNTTAFRSFSALSVLARAANSAGIPTELAATAATDAVLRESGSAIAWGTIATGGIANDAVTDAKLRNSGALSVIGRSANTTGDPADISAVAASGSVLRESGSVLGFGTIATAGIADDAVTAAKMANMAQSTIRGRAEAAGTGDPQDLTPTQVVAIIDAENAAWTGNHSFTSATFDVSTSGDTTLTAVDDLLLAATTGSVSIGAGTAAITTLTNGFVSIVATGDMFLQAATGLGLFSGHTAADVGAGDLVINATGGIAINTNATTPVVAVTNGNVETDAYGRIIFRTPSFWQAEASNDMWMSTIAGGIELNTLNAAHPTGVTNGQINANSQSSINLTAGTALTCLASSGSCTFTSTTATCTFNAATSFVVNTASTQRLTIENDGSWNIGGSNGTTGLPVVSAGSAAPPAWGQLPTAGIADAAVTLAKQANLAQSTIIGRAEGAGTGVPTALTPTQVIAIVDAESPTWTASHRFDSFIQFGTSTSLPASGDIRKAASLVVASAGAITLDSATTVFLTAGNDLNVTVVDEMNFVADNDITFNSGAGQLVVDSDGLTDGGVIKIVARGNSATPAVSGNCVSLWSMPPASGGNALLMMTDEDGFNNILGVTACSALTSRTTVTATTTATTLATHLTSPTLQTAMCWHVHAKVSLSRGSTATATTFTLQLRVGGTQRFAVTGSLNAVSTFVGYAELDCYVHVLDGTSNDAAVSGIGYAKIASSTLVITQDGTDSFTMGDSSVIDVRAFYGTGVADVSYTTLTASIIRVGIV